MKNFIILTFFLLFALLSINAQQKTSTKATGINSAALSGLTARHIGPAVMSGRITAIDGINTDPRNLYIGTAGGGVWKTTDGGSNFTSVFDKYCQSIGAVCIDQSNPETVWVGTGESNMRNTTSIGAGLYKTTDGGENWVKMGLENTEHIAKIAILPNQPNTVFVAVPGHLWNSNPERGLYRTTDGGKTWDKALYLNENTGCADIIIDPQNPNTMYCTMWEFRRQPYSFSSGGKGSGFYKSIDGGKTWNKINKGLPEGNLGRIALALAPSQPNNLFAVVEAKKTGLYISSDNGETWKEQSATSNVTARPFYFSTLVVDPKDAKRVYRPALTFSISTDGGYSFTEDGYGGGVHPDHHALWINPNNTAQMYLGTDGGVYMSVDKGNNWLHLKNLPVSQAYHVSIDNQIPYNVYTGFQDNGSWKAPSRKAGGIQNGDWLNIYGGDGFWVQPDLTNPDIVYAEYQGGNMARNNIKANESLDIQPYPLAGEQKLRWNWNTPIVASPTNPNIFYTGAQYLYKTENKGQSWSKISPDLTTNDKKKQKQEDSGGLTADNTSAENHCTIFTIAQSPLDENVIWVGTDDGNLQVTNDAGKNWQNVSKNYAKAGIPPQTWVSSIEPSRYDKNTIFVTFDNHAYGDMNTYIAKSTDAGKTFTRLNSPNFKSFAHKIKEDIVSKNILFAGTEMGLYISLNSGTDWVLMKGNIPEYAMVRDIAIDPKTNDLIIATHGRGILILDDITPLRKLNENLLNTELAFVSIPKTSVTHGHFGWAWAGPGEFFGQNPSEQAPIVYYLKNRPAKGDIKIELFDLKGNYLYDLKGSKRKGLNKIYWNMQAKPPRPVKGASTLDNSGFNGPLMPKGKYKIKLSLNDQHCESEIELIDDPFSAHTTADRELNQKTSDEAYKTTEELAFLAAKLIHIRTQLNQLQSTVTNEPLKKLLKTYNDTLNNIRKDLMATKEGTNASFFGEEKLREKLSSLYNSLIWYEGKPTDSQLNRLKGLQYDLDKETKRFEKHNKAFIDKINPMLKKEASTTISELTKEMYLEEEKNTKE